MRGYLSPLGWKHINLTGNYVWHSSKRFTRPYLIQQRSVGDRKKLSLTFDSPFLVGERVLEHFINIDQLADSCARFDLLLKEALRLQ